MDINCKIIVEDDPTGVIAQIINEAIEAHAAQDLKIIVMRFTKNTDVSLSGSVFIDSRLSKYKSFLSALSEDMAVMPMLPNTGETYIIKKFP